MKRKRTDKMTTSELMVAGHSDLALALRARFWTSIHSRRPPYTKVRDIPAKVRRTWRVPTETNEKLP